MKLNAKWTSYPYVIWMLLFTIIPLFLIGYFAFTNVEGSFTLGNVEQAIKYIPALVKSISLAAIATVLCLVLAYPFAFAMSRLSFERQKMMSMLIMLPMWMNFLLRTYAWQAILEDNGVINTILTSIGLSSVKLINTSGAVVMGMVYNYIPYMILPIYSVLAKIDNSVIEAAQDLGANDAKVFLKVVLPMSMSGVISGITMVFVPAVSTFIISKMLGGGGNLLIGDLIDMQFLGSAYNPNLGSAISLLMMILILVCMFIMNNMGSEEEMEGMLV